ncbi:MAG: Aspartyl-tRNA(Asn) amidotransferase subunit C @ Glutamyl-tRNA(Gln) amidotransferase subunit C [uncultured Thermoleophilia bacterium]|uniref:Aspartyl/glutamyl-tRNA(Asn/Gln) amidotransferase subunit C n=1 Tax=uncultured Thermoleophilia bacterium TaxID=1497501 RepID=A0A6J4UEH4_9ACTN|nr:MAG: Aspartyl-tRNA(Asn) amidotransferase subunit C @ Glutamyl-tRNA(Gln) amidotransferase subunit C [uncultured Thermoleophilia bacterium]
MALTEQEIRHVARLARLGLRDDEVERLGAELSSILAHVSAISALDLDDVPPTSHPLDLTNVLADDEPRPCLSTEEALLNAPDPAPEGFRVPPIGA